MPTVVRTDGIQFPNGSVQTVAATSGGSGTVTSVATGNGLQGGTITSTGTLSVACPGFNTVGSYCFIYIQGTNQTGTVWTLNANNNLSAGGGEQNIRAGSIYNDGANTFTRASSNILSGTWKYMGASLGTIGGSTTDITALGCRVS